jgi:hypothetical protein
LGRQISSIVLRNENVLSTVRENKYLVQVEGHLSYLDNHIACKLRDASPARAPRCTGEVAKISG